MKKIICHVLCICFLLHTGVIGNITVTPLNAAVDIGGETVIICSSNIAGALTWLYTSDCNTASGTELTDTNCDVVSGQTAHYRTEKPDEYTCNLVVSDAVLSLAGCYLCFDGRGQGKESIAFLIIVDPNANTTINSTDFIPGEDAAISTTVAYRGPAMQPIPLSPSFYWTLQSDPSHNITSYEGSKTDTSASSYIAEPAQIPNVPSYRCNLFFNPPVNVPIGGATNTPIYTKNWTTSAYAVMHAPENISIAGYPTTCPLDENESVTMMCNASGYPSPSYKWIDLAIPDVILSDSSTITIQRDGVYQCTASNVIRSVKHYISTVANVSDCECHSNCPSCDETAVIVLGVILAISLVINTGLVTWILCWRLLKERAAPGSSSRGPDDNSLRQAAYESTTKPETLPYETLEHAAAASAYQELTLEQKSDIDA